MMYSEVVVTELQFPPSSPAALLANADSVLRDGGKRPPQLKGGPLPRPASISCPLLHAFRASVALLFCIALCPAGISHAQDTQYFYYDSGGRKLPLTLCTDRIGIKFADGLTATQRASVVASLPDLLPLDEASQPRVVARKEMVVVRVKEGALAGSIPEMIDVLEKHPEVVYATGVYQARKGYDELLTDEFYVSGSGSPTDEEMAEFLNTYHLQMVRRIEWRASGRVGYLCRVTGEWPVDALETANLCQERFVGVIAGPVWQPLYPVIDTEPDDEYYDNQWSLPVVDWLDAWEAYSQVSGFGSGITIAVLDSGVDQDHPDLQSKLVGGQNFVADPPNSNPEDDNGHGTMCAGVAAADTNNSGEGIAGMAWGSSIMAVKVFDADGGATVSALADGISWAVSQGAKVLSMSWHLATDEGLLRDAIQDARGQGCVPVCSAGNTYDDSVVYPASYPEVICAGASDMSDMRWIGSGYGGHLDVMAPAVALLTYTTYLGGSYSYYFGMTSAACPHVAGLAALVLAVNGTFSPAEVQAIIEFSTDDLQYTQWTPPEVAGEGRDIYTGYGRINVAQALSLAEAPRFVIRNAEGVHIASFDDKGNFAIEKDVSILEDPEVMASLDGGFIVRDADGDGLFHLLLSGWLHILGKLYESVGEDLDASVSVPCLRIADHSGKTVALVNSESFTNSTIEPEAPYTVPAGSLVLTGKAFIGARPDINS